MSIIIVTVLTILHTISATQELECKKSCDHELLTDIQQRLERLEKNNKNVSDTNEQLESNIKDVEDKLDVRKKHMDKILLQQQEILADLSSLIDPSCKKHLPSECAKALNSKESKSGVYKIYVKDSNFPPFKVYCQKDTNDEGEEIDGDPWIIIQRRVNGVENFYRSWAKYKSGFGQLDKEFFIGLDKLHALTKSKRTELRIEMKTFNDKKIWAKYSDFKVGDTNSSYKLISLGDYTGNYEDGLTQHIGQKWSTKDVDNDENDKKNCAKTRRGAMWYKNCAYSNLNGQYLNLEHKEDDFYYSIFWYPWNEGYKVSLSYVEMGIRSRDD